MAFHEAENYIAKLSKKIDLTRSNSAQRLDMTMKEVVSDDGTRADQVEWDLFTSSGQIVLYD